MGPTGTLFQLSCTAEQIGSERLTDLPEVAQLGNGTAGLKPMFFDSKSTALSFIDI